MLNRIRTMAKYRFHNRLAPVAVLLFLAPIGCGSGEGSTRGDTNVIDHTDTVQSVESANVIQRPFERTFDATGLLAAESQARLRSLVDGPVTEVHVDIGSHVQKGDVLIRTRTMDAELALQSAEAALAVAQANWIGLKAWRRDEEIAIMRAQAVEAEATAQRMNRDEERLSSLYETGATAESRYDEARNSAQSARARLEIARQQLRIAETGASLAETNIIETQVQQAQALVAQARQGLEDTTLRAPFDGVITDRLVRVGDYARRGEEVVEIADVSTLTAEFNVPERYAPFMKAGIETDVQIPALGQTVSGGVTAVNAAIDMRTRTFLVKVTVSNDDESLKSGAFCTGSFRLPHVDAGLAIPAESVVSLEGRQFVWTVQDGVARRVEITTGERTLELIQVTSGLTEEDVVIRSGFGSLSDGDTVRTTN